MKTETQATSITVAVRDLRQILTGFGKVMGKTAPDSALGCARFIADGSGHADLAATDGDTWASIRLTDAATEGKAEFLVPVDRLKELVKPAKPADLCCLSPSGDGVSISTGTRTKVVKVPPASAFPRPPVFSGKSHPLPPGAIRAIGEALRCASTDKTRGVLNGVSLDTSGKGHHIVGTDGRHLYTANSFKLPISKPAILASNRLFDWNPIKDAREWKLRHVHDKQGRGGSYEITAGAWRIIGKLVDGDYPSWRQVVPRNGDLTSKVTFDPEKLSEIAPTLTKLPVASLDGNNHPIVVRGDGKVVELLWKEAIDEPYQDLPIPGTSSSGKPFIISIDRRYLAKAFAFGFEEMQVADEMSPARFTDSNGRQMIVMPLRMTGGIPPGRSTAPANRSRQPARKPRQKMPEKTPPRKAPTQPADSIDEAMSELAKVRDTLREAATGLQSAAAKLKRAKQEQRTANKEISSVRSTLESLRKVRL
ncbi:MAG: DNA polymerase III sliding clamp (beta) subunit (PCNA family) [Verrucomicrobiales bacterium]|jgi:DNA polymerase III sliding clamp (beta) subunit (PCNA family)